MSSVVGTCVQALFGTMDGQNGQVWALSISALEAHGLWFVVVQSFWNLATNSCWDFVKFLKNM